MTETNLLSTTALSFPEVVDSTMLVTFDSCAQKFFNEYILCLASVGISPDLHAGGAFAHGLHHARVAFYEHGLNRTESALAATRAFMQYYGDYEAPDNHPKDFVNTLCALLDYFEFYPFDADPIQPIMLANGKPAVEFTFAIPTEVMHPTTNQPIIYGGRCDMLGTYNSVGVIVDEKTTKAMGPQWAKNWSMRGQFIGYVYAAQYYGYDISTALVRGIAIQKTQYKHMQVIETYSQWQIERWWLHVHEKLNRMVAYWKMQAKYSDRSPHAMWPYSYGDGCSSYSGCPYLHLCTVESPPQWYGDYARRVWNPLEKNPTKDSPSPPAEDARTMEELMEGMT